MNFFIFNFPYNNINDIDSRGISIRLFTIAVSFLSGLITTIYNLFYIYKNSQLVT